MSSESAVSVHCSTTTKIRSYLYAGNWYQDVKMNSYSLKALLENCLCLRALDLSRQNIKKLPSSIGELLHLRYLDLSWNSNLKLLPKSISKLQNLQTLGLRECHSLEKLPKDLSNKLVKLRVLDIQGCSMLPYMPKDMTKLTCLHSLTYFVVGEARSNSQRQWFAQLQDLKSLNNLKGQLEITIRYPLKGLKEKGDHIGEGGYIKSKEHLNYISLRFVHSEEDIYERVDFEEALMEEFMPHSNLKGLKLSGYCGMRLSSWATGYNLMIFLPNIIKLHIMKCKKLEYLPCLENLVHLKILRLEGMPNLEYIVMEMSPSATRIVPTTSKSFGSSIAKESLFFPSLEELRLEDLPKLKGWWRNLRVESRDEQLSQLKSLVIHRCPNLTSIPLCPRVEFLTLWGFDASLQLMGMVKNKTNYKGETSDIIPKLKKSELDNVAWLNSFPMEAFRCLTELRIEMDDNLESLAEIEQVLYSCSSSLRTLIFWDCPKLRSISGGLEHLTGLEKLSLSYIPNLIVTERDCMPWQALSHNLRSLRLHHLQELVKLPDGMQDLAVLQTLQIWSCKRLEALPIGCPSLSPYSS